MQEGRSVFGFSSAVFPLLFALVLTAVLALAIGNDEDPVGAATDAQQQRTTTSELACLLYTSPSPRDATLSRMPSSA